MTLTLLGAVTVLALEHDDADWAAAAHDNPVAYAPHTPYYTDRAPRRVACCRFAVDAAIHRADVVGYFADLLPHLEGAR